MSGAPVALSAFGLPGVPEVRAGDDLGALLGAATQRAGGLLYEMDARTFLETHGLA